MDLYELFDYIIGKIEEMEQEVLALKDVEEENIKLKSFVKDLKFALKSVYEHNSRQRKIEQGINIRNKGKSGSDGI